jgi:hypothetical protein
VYEYAVRFAFEARVPVTDVPRAAPAVAGALARHLSPGQLEEALAQLPERLRVQVAGPAQDPALTPGEAGPVELTDADKLLADLEDRIDNLSAAVRALALGFEEHPGAGVDEQRRARAARVAADILIAGRTAATPRSQSG